MIPVFKVQSEIQVHPEYEANQVLMASRANKDHKVSKVDQAKWVPKVHKDQLVLLEKLVHKVSKVTPVNLEVTVVMGHQGHPAHLVNLEWKGNRENKDILANEEM